MANGPAPNKWLSHLVHLDRTHHARLDALLFERILQGQRVDHGGQHSHVIGGYAIHFLGLLGYASEEVSAAYYQANLNSKPLHVGNFLCDFVQASVIDAKALSTCQCLARELKKNALIDRISHG
jgi:hypothetical protein